MSNCDALLTRHLIGRIIQHNTNNPSNPIPFNPTSSHQLPLLLPGLSIPLLCASSLDTNSSPKKITISLSFNSPSDFSHACSLFTQLNIEHKSLPKLNPASLIGTVRIPHAIDNDTVQQHLSTHAPNIRIDIARELQDMEEVTCHRTNASFRCPVSMIHSLSSIPPWPGTPSHRSIEWSYISRPFSTCTHCFHTGHGKQACDQAHKHNKSAHNNSSTHACIICRSFGHHADACHADHKHQVGCLLCRDAMDVDMSICPTQTRPHVITACPLFKGSRTVINKDTKYISHQRQKQHQQQKQQQQQQQPQQSRSQQQQLQRSNAWFPSSNSATSASSSISAVDVAEICRLIIRETMSALIPQIVSTVVSQLQQHLAATTTELTSSALPTSTISRAPTPGVILVTPATSNTTIPQFSTPAPKPKPQQRDRTMSQPNIKFSLSRTATTSTATITTAAPSSKTTTTPAAPITPVRTNKPSTTKILIPTHRVGDPVIVAESHNEKDQTLYTVEWPSQHRETMTYDDLYEKYNGSLGRWVGGGLQKWTRRQQQQQQQQVIPTSNQYTPIEIDENQQDPTDEIKHDQETQGKPGSSQDDMTRQTSKRHRESLSSPSETTDTDTLTSTSRPSSARNLSDQMDPNGKPLRKRTQRSSAAAATEAIAHQQQQEQQNENDHE